MIVGLSYRYVEQPARRLSMAVGHAVGRRTRRDERVETADLPDALDIPAAPPVRAMADATSGNR